jgi:hypothetical protein
MATTLKLRAVSGVEILTVKLSTSVLAKLYLTGTVMVSVGCEAADNAKPTPAPIAQPAPAPTPTSEQVQQRPAYAPPPIAATQVPPPKPPQPAPAQIPDTDECGPCGRG